METSIYITRMNLQGAETSDGRPAPEAVYRVTVDGETLVANRNGNVWFTQIDTAMAVAYDALKDAGVPDLTRIVWEPQYDSAFGELFDEPCGYVGKVA